MPRAPHCLARAAQHELATGGEKGTKTSKAQGFFLKVLLKGKFVFYIYILYFCTYCRGQPFLVISDEQTGLPSILSPTSDFPCGVTMFIIISKEKENVVKKKKTTTKQSF